MVVDIYMYTFIGIIILTKEKVFNEKYKNK